MLNVTRATNSVQLTPNRYAALKRSIDVIKIPDSFSWLGHIGVFELRYAACAHQSIGIRLQHDITRGNVYDQHGHSRSRAFFLHRPSKYSLIFKSKQSLASPPLTGCWLLELG